MRRLSATMAFAPPGPRSLAIVVDRYTRSSSRFFMAEKGGEGWRSGTRLSKLSFSRDNYEFATNTRQDCAWLEGRNSPETPVSTAKQASQHGRIGHDFEGKRSKQLWRAATL